MRAPRAAAGLGIVVAAILLAALGLAAYVWAGAYDIAATRPHSRPIEWLIQTVQERSVAARADEVPEPPPADSINLAIGFEHYHAMCVTCHGAPGVDPSEIGEGIYPSPPKLAEERIGISDRETFWIVDGGLKLAGMPAFGPTHSVEEIWGIVRVVELLPDLTAEEYRRRTASADTMQGAPGGGHTHGPDAPPHH